MGYVRGIGRRNEPLWLTWRIWQEKNSIKKPAVRVAGFRGRYLVVLFGLKNIQLVDIF